MKLSAYIVRHDSGFAPNPFGPVCTLACCKPSIRRAAKKDDIIVGTGAAQLGLAGRLIYAMRVNRVIPYDKYWIEYPSKRAPSRSPVKKRGDNIWHRDKDGKWRCARGAFHDEENRSRDLRGRNVLISSEFYYFGRDAIAVPEEFQSLLATARGHRNSGDQELIKPFWSWLRRQAPDFGRMGLPADFEGASCTGCDC
jgi:Nucleotide modification associated domain 2